MKQVKVNKGCGALGSHCAPNAMRFSRAQVMPPSRDDDHAQYHSLKGACRRRLDAEVRPQNLQHPHDLQN